MLVGRQAEQRAIDQLVAGARLGTSGVLAILGEAGVGKTALIDDAVTRLDGMRILRATGLETEREIPFGTLLQLLRPALGSLHGIPRAQAQALASALALSRHEGSALPGSPIADGRDRFTIGAAVLSLLCRYAEDGPVAVMVDDFQVADAASASTLAFAARRLSADPVMVLLGVRSPDGDDAVAGLPRLVLAGLDLDATRLLIARTRGGHATEEQVRSLHDATAGNPLALLELGAADPTSLEGVEAGMPLRVPRAVTRAFGRRLGRLDGECRAVLLLAAVCGADLRLITHACAALGLDVGRLGEAEDSGFVTVAGGRVDFRHPLLRAAAYSAASVDERRAAHRAAADATPRDDVDRRAWHLSEAVWQPDGEVADLLATAAEHAVLRGAYSVAAGAFERSARVSPDGPTREARLLRAADTAWAAGDGERALALLEQRDGVAGAADPSRDVHAIELRASIAARSGSLREALELLVAAADSVGDPDDEAVALADAVHATYYLGDAHTAARLADRLEALRGRVLKPRSRTLALMATGMARTLAGQGGADEIRAAVPLLESDPDLAHDPRRLSWLLLAPLFLRDSTSGSRLRALVDEVRGAAGIGALPAVLFHVARDESTTDARWTRAEADYTEAIRLATETRQTTELAMSLAGLAWLESRAGRAEACRVHAAQARELCIARDIHVGEVWVSLATGDLELSLGRVEEAARELTRLGALLERLALDDVDLAPGPELTDALLRLGRRAEAEEVARTYRERAVAKGQPWARARADRSVGLLAGDADVDAWFESALAWHDRTLDRFETARTQLAFGSRLRRAGRRIDARIPLRSALDAFAELGAHIWRDHAATELAATGEHVRAAGSNPLAALTAQELQVSVLLADGRTTREAATALFLSPKTVEYHLRKVYTKLGISSRTELATALRGPAAS
ncbi:LuxR family transcriptional regulator [Microbacterium sp. BK668]|uniref:ATP-binding protein n=1 Tax=Microbacterium sp. BK668 TaxID=2512118 RepID=UPI001060EFF0|nr:LuxR family transcriptional regulator [Microbacterium sp. BK668]TDN92064.1 regulatory LuxR family protein [Microbacterium sp. BK668]